MITKRAIPERELCEGTQRLSEGLLGNGNADLHASGPPKSGRARTWRRCHWEAALWAFAIAGWSVLVYLYHSHLFLP
jgi:hypothetical protein